jgi:hypothetical protein
MAFNDAIYGRSKRYVSRERLQSMLEYEHGLNLERLQPLCGGSTAFFAFADTVAARKYQGTDECHGWTGVKFQAHPRYADSQVILHVRMLDQENSLQQEARGIEMIEFSSIEFRHIAAEESNNPTTSMRAFCISSRVMC